MDIRSYFESLGSEFRALEQRVRYLLADAHWQTDGEWKESVLRQVLRRHLPSSAVVGRGFVVSSAWVSHQLDVLIYDAAKPVVFRDADLVVTTADAVLGVIEVKSKISLSQLRETAKKLAHDMGNVRSRSNSEAFAGVFSYSSWDAAPERYLESIASAASRWNERLDFACLDPNRFIRYWHFDPRDDSRMYQRWHSYSLRGLASAYFVHNVIDAVSPYSVVSNSDVWYPSHGKEPFCDGVAASSWMEAE